MQMLWAHPEIEAIEYPFVDTYYFGQESLTLRRNARMEAAKQRFQANPALAQTFQAAFDQLEQSIQSAQLMVCRSPVPYDPPLALRSTRWDRATPPSSKNMLSPS